MVDQGKVAGGLAVTMHPHTLVNGRKVVEHFVRLLDLVLQMAEQSMNLVSSHPKSRDTIAGGLKGSGRPNACDNGINNRWCSDHTWSGSRRSVVFCLDGRNKSRMEGRGGRVVCCWPTTQLSGR